MAKVVVIGLPGETGLWVADIDAGTVTPLQPTAGSPLDSANKLRASGVAINKGVDFSVAGSSAAEAFSGHLDP